jgi:hypothetical protein
MCLNYRTLKARERFLSNLMYSAITNKPTHFELYPIEQSQGISFRVHYMGYSIFCGFFDG